MRAMSFADLRTGPLTRVWRRQLFGASTAALIVPSAMLAAVAVLVLGRGFGSVGVLGQLFAGPSLPGVGVSGGARGQVGPGVGAGRSAGVGGRGFAAGSLPVIPAVAGARAAPGRAPARAGRTVLTARGGTGAAGGAIGGAGRTMRPVTEGAGRSGSGGSSGGGSGGGGSSPSGSSPTGSSPTGSSPTGSSPSGSSPSGSAPAPPPQPSAPQPTPVDTAVKVVTSVTQRLPAPVGPVATQAVQAAGSAVDNLLPQTGQPTPAPVPVLPGPAPLVPGSPAGGPIVP